MIKDNNWVLYINGYLDAISDMNGSQREFYIRLSIFRTSSQLSLKDKIQKILDIENINVLKLEGSKKISVIYFLEKLLIFKPFTGLYNNKINNSIPKEIKEEYKDYILFHLGDYIDFALEEENIKFPYKEEIDLALIKNQEKYFIVVIQKIKNRELLWVFFYNLYDENRISHLFNNLISYIDDKIEILKERGVKI